MQKYLRSPLYKLLDLEKGELRPVLILLAISFFLGICIITYDIGSSTMFLEVYQKGRISEAFLISGLLGICTTLIFAYFQKRIPFSLLVKITLLFVLAGILLFSILLQYNSELHYLRYVIFVSLGSMNALVLLCFYGIIGRAFNIRNEKRLTSTVDQGQMFATVIAFFVVFLIPSSVPVVDYFYISLIALIVLFCLYLFFIVKHSTEKLTKINKQEELEASMDFKHLINNKYIRLLAQFSLLSITLLQFMEFSFFSAGIEAYKEVDANGKVYINDIDLAKFLAGYGTVLTLFNMLFQLIGASRLVGMVGSKLSLFILPVLLGFFSLATVFIGLIFGDAKYDTMLGINETFILFFIFICLSKIFLQTCINSFEEPIFKHFFLPINSQIRHDVQTKVEGTFRQFSIVIAAGFLILFGLFSFKLIYFSLALFVAACIYAYMVINLYREYQLTLHDSLRIQRGKIDETNDLNDKSIQAILLSELKIDNEVRIVNTLKLIEFFDPALFEKTISLYLNHPSLSVKQYIYAKIEDLKLVTYKEQISQVAEITEMSDATKLLAESALKRLNELEEVVVSHEDIIKLSKSKKIIDKELSVTLIRNNFNDELARRLFDLLRDSTPSVRKAALVAAGSVKLSQYRMLMVDNLSLPVFTYAASSGLQIIGEEVIPTLELAFYKTGQKTQTKIRIIQIYSKIGGEAAVEALWNKIAYPDRKIVSEALLAIRNLGYVAKGERASKIKQILIHEMGLCAWKIAALEEIAEDVVPTPLYQALIEETEEDDEHIFMLLSIVYHPSSVKLVEDSLKTNTVEGIMYAIELLEVFIDSELKPMLIPLLDQISISKKNEKLKLQFLRATYDPITCLYKLINKDCNEINRWTKACAINKLLLVKNARVTDTLVANLFNPDKLLREISAYVIHKLSPHKYENLSMRMSDKDRKEMNDFFYDKRDLSNKTLMFDRILFFKTIPIFKYISGAILANLVDYIEEVELNAGDILYKDVLNEMNSVIIIYKGMLSSVNDDLIVAEYEERTILGDALVLPSDNLSYTISAATDAVVYKINKERYYDIISNYYSLAKIVIPRLNDEVEIINTIH